MDILIIDDDESIRTSTCFAIEAEDHYAEAVESADAARLRLKEESFELLFLDLDLGPDNGLDLLAEILGQNPNQLVVIFTAYASVETAIRATKLGAFDYLSKPFKPDQVRAILLKAQKELTTQDKIVQLESTVTELKSQVDVQSPPNRFDSQDAMMQGALDTLFRAAKTPASILLLGESGTGKSVIARTIHQNSNLADKPFVTVSCPSLSKELLESELFGHTKGAFTGAIKDSWGKVHAANGGTLFLDEIGELPIEIQPKLLRLLQEREYERLGENKTYQANVRIIAATNQDLKKAITDGSFREDLYYRINVISVELPPLRARATDLLRFAQDYLSYFSNQIGREIQGFSKKALDLLHSYQWPGNLRELRNAIERATILCAQDEIQALDLPSDDTSTPASSTGNSAISPGALVTLEELETEHIQRIIARVENLQEAAKILGIDKATLYRKRKKLREKAPASEMACNSAS